MLLGTAAVMWRTSDCAHSVMSRRDARASSPSTLPPSGATGGTHRSVSGRGSRAISGVLSREAPKSAGLRGVTPGAAVGAPGALPECDVIFTHRRRGRAAPRVQRDAARPGFPRLRGRTRRSRGV